MVTFKITIFADGSGIEVYRETRSTLAPPVACLTMTSYDHEELFAAITAGSRIRAQ